MYTSNTLADGCAVVVLGGDEKKRDIDSNAVGSV